MVRLCLLAILGVAFVTARPADACDCATPRQTCEALGRATIVFVGTVKDTAPAAQRELETRVTIEEVFRGAPGKVAVIKVGSSSATCDYSGYKLGERMLIFASAWPDGRLSVSGCSRTAPVAQAAADLAELRRAARLGTGRVSGRVALADGTPRANIEVRAAGTSFSTRTGAQGEYQLDLPRGRYTIEPEPDRDLAPRKGSPIEIAAPGVCATQHFTEQWNGRIRGTLLDPKGKPAANVLVRAFPASALVPPVLEAGATWAIGTTARSDASGKYELGPLAPGTYRVAVGAPFDPADPIPATYHAPDLVVPRGGVVADVDLVIPPRLKLRSVTGRVTVQGKLAARDRLEVTLTELASQRTYRRSLSLPAASFQLAEADGTTVELRACANELDCSRPVRVRLDRDVTVELALTLP